MPITKSPQLFDIAADYSGGGTINLDVNDLTEIYIFQGAAVSPLANIVIQPSGSATSGMCYKLLWTCPVDVITNGVDVTIFGRTLTTNEALSSLIIDAIYDGARWVVNIGADTDSTVITDLSKSVLYSDVTIYSSSSLTPVNILSTTLPQKTLYSNGEYLEIVIQGEVGNASPYVGPLVNVPMMDITIGGLSYQWYWNESFSANREVTWRMRLVRTSALNCTFDVQTNLFDTLAERNDYDFASSAVSFNFPVGINIDINNGDLLTNGPFEVSTISITRFKS